MITNTIKSVILLMAVYLITRPATAQFSYFHVGGGYGLPSSPVNFRGMINSTNHGGTKTHERIKFSLGKGINLNGAFGYMFNDYFGAELGVNYLMSSTWETIYSSDVSIFSQYSVQKMNARMTRINPMFILQSKQNKITPYAKFGIMFGFGKIKTSWNNTLTEWGDERIYDVLSEVSGGQGIGYNAALGANFEIGDNMFIFGELAIVNMSYSPIKGEYTKYTRNGSDLLPNMDVSDKKFVFVDSYEQSGTTPSTEPSKVLTEKYPFGSVGINIGFRMSFN